MNRVRERERERCVFAINTRMLKYLYSCCCTFTIQYAYGGTVYMRIEWYA